MSEERLKEILKLNIASIKSLINFYEDQYEQYINEASEEGWTEDGRKRANDLMNIISDYEWALHYKNVMTSDDNFSVEFHNICRKVGK